MRYSVPARRRFWAHSWRSMLCILLLLELGCNDGSDDDGSSTPGQGTPPVEGSPTASPGVTPTLPGGSSTPGGSQTPSSPTPGSPPPVTATPTLTPSPTPALVDQDSDGYSPDGDPADCNDLQASIYPGADELPYDGVDQDCDGIDLTDADSDGHDAYAAGGDDCDDDDPDVHPGASEVPYDGIDQDCDGTDLLDVDGDGHTASAAGGDDCNDQQASIYAGAKEVPYDGIDQDCDGADLIDVDGDGHASSTVSGGDDCDDTDLNTYPGAPEFADGKDNDCDGSIDEELDTTDDDHDGTSEAQGDCNDGDAGVHPGASELPYDGIDQDCDGTDLTDVDGDGYAGGKAGSSPPDCNDNDPKVHPDALEVPYDSIDQDCRDGDLVDVDLDGFAATAAGGTDCNDDDAKIKPGATDIPYDGIDQDCSGGDTVDVDGDGYASTDAAGTDCDDHDAAVNPAAKELCDGIDNNCDGVTDSDAIDRGTYYPDVDHDAYGDPGSPVKACAAASGQVKDGTDCDDAHADSHPGALEVCDGRDNDCDTQIDEGVTSAFYRDSDGDGYGDLKSPTQACAAPAGYVADATDCDDTRSSVHPNAAETCNLTDDDCDGQIDEGVLSTFYQDSDDDGFGNAAKTTQACTAPAGYVANSTDCNDKSADIYPGAPELCNSKDDDCNGAIDDGVTTHTYYQDSDHDGYGSSSATQQTCTAAPTGYVSIAGDCDDSSAAINPAAAEACNGVDDNCNGAADEGAKTTFYADTDKDGYGDPGSSTQACSAPAGYITNSQDCNDKSAAVYPGATEQCNGVDDDCDTVIDDGVKQTWYRDVDLDGYGSSSSTTQACTVPAGYVGNSQDCDDSNGAIHPGATESCNAKDDDCDGQVDEGVTSSFYKDADGDSYGDPAQSIQACSAPAGYVSNKLDCNDQSSAVKPGATETCNSIDDDCNGSIDDNAGSIWYRDSDGDGYGDATSTKQACSKPTGYVADKTDCQDASNTIYPGATEVCNKLDDDCDGSVDEGVTTTWYRDADGDGYGSPSVTSQACTVPTGYVANSQDCNDSSASVNPGQTETSNGVDDNCNGQIDEGIIALSCKDLKQRVPSSVDGVYTIDPDGSGSGAQFAVYCDMTTDGGGWTLCVNSVLGSRAPHTDMVSNLGTVGWTTGYTRDCQQLAVFNSAEIRHLILRSGSAGVVNVSYVGKYHDALPVKSGWKAFTTTARSGEVDDGSSADCTIGYHYGRTWQTSGSCVNTYGFPWYYGSCWNVIPVENSGGYCTLGPGSSSCWGGGCTARHSIFVR